MRKKRVWFLLFVLTAFMSLGLYSKAHYKKDRTEPDPFVLLTITKSGTFLAINMLEKMTGYIHNDHGNQDLGDVNQFSYYHMYFHPKVKKKLFKEEKKLKKIILVRDLRDVCVSITDWVQRDFVGMLVDSDKQELCKLGNNPEKIKWVLNHEYNEGGEHKWGFHVANQAKLTCELMNKKNVLLVRFENLVGSRGGGSDEAQFNEVKKIAQFINAPIKNDDEQLKALAFSLFGNNKNTFRKGQIGNWTDHFDKDIETLFNEKLLMYQKKLGYE